MTNFEQWKAEMTVELAAKINEEMEMWSDEDEYSEIPTNEEELNAWRKENNLFVVAEMYGLSDCRCCPVDDTDEGCPASDSCFDDFMEWAEGDSSWNENRAAEIAEHENEVESFRLEIDKLKDEAEQGDADAQCRIGECHLELGILTREIGEFEQAYLWYKKSAEQGNANAQAKLGDFYSTNHIDLSVKKDDEKAIYWYKKAAAQGLELGVWEKHLIEKHSKK